MCIEFITNSIEPILVNSLKNFQKHLHEENMINLDWRLLLLFGIGALCFAGYEFYYGYQIKISGESFSKYWVLGLAFAWVGSDLIQKAFNKRSKTPA